MYGLPPACEVKKQLPKKNIYPKFHFSPSQRERFDADIARIDIVAQVSSSSIPALAAGVEIKGFYVLRVQLKRKEIDMRNIALLSKLIPQKLVFALVFEEQTQFAIFHTKLITASWQSTALATLPLSGLNIDSVWENIVKSIGCIEVEQGNSLAEQIAVNNQREKIMAQIASLERKMAKEKQPRRKREYFTQISNLKSQIP